MAKTNSLKDKEKQPSGFAQKVVAAAQKTSAQPAKQTSTVKAPAGASGFAQKVVAASAQKSAATQRTVPEATQQKSRIINAKWYSGDQPTGRETVAQIYRMYGQDEKAFNQYMTHYAAASQEKGTPLYNPYSQATNQKAIQELAKLGVDVSGGINQAFFDANIGYRNYDRKNTGDTPLAPSSKSTRENDIAYWLYKLQQDEETTAAAENELKSMADEIAYWVGKGYSDDEVLAKIDMGNYKTLAKMDEGRASGTPVGLNRAINWNDDTKYGMLYAARNGGGSGDYLTDAVQYTLGRGKKYKADAKSEAARDPSSYENYNPYAGGSTLDDARRATGQEKFDRNWLEANRSMLATEDGKKMWNSISEAVDNTEAAQKELDELNAYVAKQLERGKTPREIIEKIEKDGLIEKEYKTLAKMEDYRVGGGAFDLADSVNFTWPQFKAQVLEQQILAENAAGAASMAAAMGSDSFGYYDKFDASVQQAGEAGNKIGAKMLAGIAGYLKGNGADEGTQEWLDKYGYLVSGEIDYGIGRQYNYDERYKAGNDAYELLKLTDDANLSAMDKASIAFKIGRDMEAAEKLGMKPDKYYASEQGATAKAELEEMKGAVRGIIEQTAAENERMIKMRRDAGMDVLARGDAGDALTTEEQEYHDYVRGLNVDAIMDTDAGVHVLRQEVVDAAYEMNPPVEGENGMVAADVQSTISMLAMSYTKEEVQNAAALGMSYAEYVEAYPDRATSAAELVQRATNEFNSVWSSYGNDLSAKLNAVDALNAQMQAASTPAAPEGVEYGEGVGALKTIGKGAQHGWESHLYSTADWIDYYFLSGTDQQIEAAMRNTYGNDPAAYRAAVESAVAKLGDEDERAYWTEQLAGEGDVFKLGYNTNTDGWQQFMYQRKQNMAAIEKYMQENGTQGENLAMSFVSSATDNSLRLAESIVLNAATGGKGSLLRTALVYGMPEASSMGRELEASGVDPMAARAAGIANAIWTGLSEQYMEAKYLPDSMRGKGQTLAMKGMQTIATKNPGLAAKLGMKMLDIVATAAEEGTQEVIQDIGSTTIKDIALAAQPDKLFASSISGEALKNDFVMGALMSPLLSVVGMAGHVPGKVAQGAEMLLEKFAEGKAARANARVAAGLTEAEAEVGTDNAEAPVREADMPEQRVDMNENPAPAETELPHQNTAAAPEIVSEPLEAAKQMYAETEFADSEMLNEILNLYEDADFQRLLDEQEREAAVERRTVEILSGGASIESVLAADDGFAAAQQAAQEAEVAYQEARVMLDEARAAKAQADEQLNAAKQAVIANPTDNMAQSMFSNAVTQQRTAAVDFATAQTEAQAAQLERDEASAAVNEARSAAIAPLHEAARVQAEAEVDQAIQFRQAEAAVMAEAAAAEASASAVAEMADESVKERAGLEARVRSNQTEEVRLRGQIYRNKGVDEVMQRRRADDQQRLEALREDTRAAETRIAEIDAAQQAQAEAEAPDPVLFTEENVSYARAGVTGQTIVGKAAQQESDSSKPKGKKGKKGKKLANPIGIAQSLAKALGVGEYQGTSKFSGPEGTVGVYHHIEQYFETSPQNAANYNASMHEIGHVLSERLGMTANQDMVDALPQKVKEAYYDPNTWPGEAFTEFVSHYMRSRDAAIGFAGLEYVQAFEQRLKEEKLLKTVADHAEALRGYINQSTQNKLKALIINEEDRREIKDFKSFMRVFTTRMVDRTRPLEDVDAAIRDAGIDAPSLRQAGLARAYRERAAERCISEAMVDRRGRIVGLSLAETIARAAKGTELKGEALMNEVNACAVAMHAIDRAKAGKPVFGEDDIDVDALEATVKKYKNEHWEIYRAAQATTKWYNDFFRLWLVDSGAVAPQTFAQMNQMYPNYVPLMRNVAVGSGTSTRTTFKLKGAVKGGSDLEIINPFDSIVQNVTAIVSAVSRNEVAKRFDMLYRMGGLGEFAREIPNSQVDYVEQAQSNADRLEQANDRGESLPEFMHFADALAQAGAQPGNVINVFLEDGTIRSYEVRDKMLFNALADLDTATGETGLEIWGKLTRTMSALTTGQNVFFGINNALRDIGNAVNYGSFAYTYLDGIPKVIASAVNIVRNAPEYRDWIAQGGGGWSPLVAGSATSAKEYRNKLFNRRAKKSGETVERKGLWKGTIDATTFLNQLSEEATRFAEYKYGKHDKTTDLGREQAFMASMDLTVDFQRSGNSQTYKAMKQLIPFFGPAVQGLYKTGRMFTAAERGRLPARLAKTVFNTGLRAAAQHLLVSNAYGILKLLGWDDDEAAEVQREYELLPEDMRNGYLLIPLRNQDSNRRFVRIPLEEDALARSIYATTLNALKAGDVEEFTDDMLNFGKRLLSDAIPNPFTGSIVAPIVSIISNKAWHGGDIVSGSLQDRAVTQQYNEDTPEMFIRASRALDVWGIQISPLHLKYATEQYTGVIGQLAIPVFSRDKYTGEWSIPLALNNLWKSTRNRYTTDPAYSNDVTDAFYEGKTQLTQIVDAHKNGLGLDMLNYTLSDEEMAEAADEAKQLVNGVFAEAQEEIKALYAEIDEINRDDSLSYSQKERLSRAAKMDIVRWQEIALDEYMAYAGKYGRGGFFERLLNMPAETVAAFNAPLTQDE